MQSNSCMLRLLWKTQQTEGRKEYFKEGLRDREEDSCEDFLTTNGHELTRINGLIRVHSRFFLIVFGSGFWHAAPSRQISSHEVRPTVFPPILQCSITPPMCSGGCRT